MILNNYLKKNQKKQIIFDFDQTLVTLHIDWNNLRKLFWPTMAKIDFAITKKTPNKPGMAVVLNNKIIKKHGNKAKKIADKFFQKYELDNFSGYSENKQLTNFVKKNKNNYKFHIWTSNCKKTILPILHELKIAKFFDNIITANNVTFCKPKKNGFNLIFDNKTQKRSDFLFVGDSLYDKLAAKNAKIDFLKIKHIIKSL